MAIEMLNRGKNFIEENWRKFKERKSKEDRIVELPEKYPKGLFMYYSPRHLSWLKNIFEDTIPDRLILPIPQIGDNFPTDMGFQVGDLFVSNEESYTLEWAILEKLFRTVYTSSLFAPPPESLSEALQKILPQKGPLGRYKFIEGGDTVPIGGTNDVVGILHGFLSQSLVDDTFKENGINFHNGLFLEHAINHVKKFDPYNPIYMGHPDLILTGFKTPNGIVGYIDEPIFDYLHYQGYPLDWFPGELRPFPKYLTERGGLNIKYIDNVALVTSYKAIAPLRSELDSGGFKIEPLGEAQWAQNGGPKCRSLDLQWREGAF